jgi:ABC-type phosphate/phosphonate transport system substrate-binding protein/rhodanese-related sulfurtransferase
MNNETVRRTDMRGRWLVWGLLLALIALPARAADLVLNVTLDYDQERDHVAVKSTMNEFAAYLGRALGAPLRLEMTQNAERVGEHVRTQSYDILMAPSQLIGLAMRHGYVPVARSELGTRVDLVARAGSGIKTFEQARGKVLVLPHRESLVSYIMRGELNAMGVSPTTYFQRVIYVNGYEAALYSLEIGQADVVALKASSFDAWLKANPGATTLKRFPEVPLAGIVVSGKLPQAQRDRLRAALTNLDKGIEAKLAKSGFGAMDPAEAADFEYVSTRGFFTPEVLPGAVIVKAKQVAEMMAKGVPLFDVRPNSHYREGHIPKAVNVPYAMNSAKEIEYDDAVDKFDVSKLPQDKNAPMIFQCNGAECWYSYKASRYMIKRGYTRIHWFRTGLPDWKASGYPIEK